MLKLYNVYIIINKIVLNNNNNKKVIITIHIKYASAIGNE